MSRITHKAAALLLSIVLFSAALPPASAFFWKKEDRSTQVLDFSKNSVGGTSIEFTPEDFVPDGDAPLQGITITSLPETALGSLMVGGHPLAVGDRVEYTALSGLQFVPCSETAGQTGAFTFRSFFKQNSFSKKETTVSLYLLAETNHVPIAQNLGLHTYQNIPVTGHFNAKDHENDILTYSLTSTPSRGSVTLSDDRSSAFVYTPYEDKTGYDSFTFVVTDTAGNTSPEATVSIRITKAHAGITYADLDHHPAHKAAIHLAEEGLYVGATLNGSHFFYPEQPVSRVQFLTMAMGAADVPPMEHVTLTGFYDDQDIPGWAKGYVSAALRQGTIQGSQNEYGAPVFDPSASITRGEATVMVNQLLDFADVPLEVFSPNQHHWASQSAANLTACGILPAAQLTGTSLSEPMTLADTAELLDQVLELRSTHSLLSR